MPPCQTLPLYTTHLLHRRVITAVMDGPGTPPAPPGAGRNAGGRSPRARGRPAPRRRQFIVCIYLLAPDIGTVMDGYIL